VERRYGSSAQCKAWKRFSDDTNELQTLRNHWEDESPYCHGLNSMELTSVSSATPELSMAARCSAYLPLYWYTSRSPHGVGEISSVMLNHFGVNCSPLVSRVLFSALCCSSSLLFCAPDFDMSPFSRAYLSGLNLESEGKSFLGAVSKLFNLCAKYVYWYLSFGGVAATFQTWGKNKIEQQQIRHRGVA
jgi:hypothetical protein